MPQDENGVVKYDEEVTNSGQLSATLYETMRSEPKDNDSNYQILEFGPCRVPEKIICKIFQL